MNVPVGKKMLVVSVHLRVHKIWWISGIATSL